MKAIASLRTAERHGWMVYDSGSYGWTMKLVGKRARLVIVRADGTVVAR